MPPDILIIPIKKIAIDVFRSNICGHGKVFMDINILELRCNE
jgi:hypothetical protein